MRHVSILLIDDDPQAQALIEMALMDAHFERTIEVVVTAVAGLERIKADEHDIYLVDQRLPDGTGLDLIRTAKDLGANKPFILMTGYGSGALDEAALREGRRRLRRETSRRRAPRAIDPLCAAQLAGEPRRFTTARSSSGSRRRWKRSAVWRAASRTTSTTC